MGFCHAVDLHVFKLFIVHTQREETLSESMHKVYYGGMSFLLEVKFLFCHVPRASSAQVSE